MSPYPSSNYDCNQACPLIPAGQATEHTDWASPTLFLSSMPEFDALGRTPAERQSRWRRKIHAAQKPAEMNQVRESLKTGKPLGTPEFVERKAQILGLNLNPRRRGRPRNSENAGIK